MQEGVFSICILGEIMSDDILDLFTGNMKMRNNRSSSYEGSKIGRKDDKEAYAAPIEKMSEVSLLRKYSNFFQ